MTHTNISLTRTNPYQVQALDQDEASSGHLWQARLEDAIRSNDTEGVWSLIQHAQDQQAAHDQVATLTSRLAYRLSGKTHFSEMLLMPVVQMPGTSVIDNQDVWKAASFAIAEALSGWVDSGQHHVIFPGISSFDFVSTWQPAVLRGHLYASVPGTTVERANILTENIDLPAHAPRLGFVRLVLTSRKGWPGVPHRTTNENQRLTKVASFALQSEFAAHAPIVLPPDVVQASVSDGVALWLGELHRACTIKGWSLGPSLASPDVVKISLHLKDEQVRYTQFTLRLHQVGMQGLQDVVQMLMSLAPTMEPYHDGAPTPVHPAQADDEVFFVDA